MATVEDMFRYGVGSQGVYIQDGGASGLQKGDKLVLLDDVSITTLSDIKKALLHHHVGDSIDLTYERNGRQEVQPITLVQQA